VECADVASHLDYSEKETEHSLNIRKENTILPG
jgi:hypothetical protein